MTTPRFYEDFRFGESFTTGWTEVRTDEALAFANEYDPQAFHADEQEAGRYPLFRKLSASGYYTLLLTHRLVLEEEPGHAWGLIGKGIDRLRWLLPVRIGDRLRATGRVIGLSRDPAKPYGIVQVEVGTENQDGKPVLAMVVHSVVPTRAAADLPAEAA